MVRNIKNAQTFECVKSFKKEKIVTLFAFFQMQSISMNLKRELQILNLYCPRRLPQKLKGEV
jgi:hypothetical protein